MFKEDIQIRSRPECELCKESAMFMYSGKWVCGKCLGKLREEEKKSQTMIFEKVKKGN